MRLWLVHKWWARLVVGSQKYTIDGKLCGNYAHHGLWRRYAGAEENCVLVFAVYIETVKIYLDCIHGSTRTATVTLLIRNITPPIDHTHIQHPPPPPSISLHQSESIIEFSHSVFEFIAADIWFYSSYVYVCMVV